MNVEETDRRTEIEHNLQAVRRRVAQACADADRAASEVTLIVVTKFFPATDVQLLADLGVADVGENRHQEAEQKQRDCAEAGVRWHFIGGIQSNKAAAVAQYADVVHSVDRAKIARGLANGVERSGRDPLEVLIQVDLDAANSQGRNGAAPADVAPLAEQIQDTPQLVLGGLMAVAPIDADPAAAFAMLAEIRAGFVVDHPHAVQLSAGMSGDLEAAIAAGATHVRVGSAVLGSRPSVG